MSTDRTRISPALARGLGFNGENRYTRMELLQALSSWLISRGICVSLLDSHIRIDDEEVRTTLGVPPEEALTVLNLNTYLSPHILDFPPRVEEPASERPPE